MKATSRALGESIEHAWNSIINSVYPEYTDRTPIIKGIHLRIDMYRGIYSNRSKKLIHVGLLTLSQIIEDTKHCFTNTTSNNIRLVSLFVIMHEFMHFIYPNYSEKDINTETIKNIKKYCIADKDAIKSLENAFCQ